MHSGIDRATLDRLAARGRSKGALTVQDLKDHLPVEDLSADTIALVVAHLEDAGISVELDDDLVGGHGRTKPLEIPGIDLQSSADSGRLSPASQPAAGGALGPADVRDGDPHASSRRDGPGAHKAVFIAGLCVLVLLGLSLLMLG